MGVLVRTGERSLEIESPHLRGAIDLGGPSLTLGARDHPPAIEGVVPGVILGDRTVQPRSGALEEQETLETPAGPITRLRIRCPAESGLEIELEIELGSQWPGIVMGMRVRNRGTQPLRIQALEPFCWLRSRGGRLGLPGDPGELRFFRMGYQSWSPAGFLRPGRRDRRPRLPLARTMLFGPFTPLPQRGLQVSDFVATLRAPGRRGLTLGFLTHRRFLTHVALDHQRGRITGLRARVALEGLPLGPGETREGERLWIGLEGPEQDGLATWAERAGQAMQACRPDRARSAWCSWYRFFTGVSADDIRRQARTLSALEPRVDTIQIDDGFQAAVGDWLEPGPGFPAGIAPLGREIREAGFDAGLWLAPLLASRTSRLARQHPGWLLRGPGGKPRVAAFHPAWSGRTAYALDPTHPEVLAWLEELGGHLRRRGFNYLKLDFLYAATLPGARHDRSAPSGTAYRGAIEAIRRGAGPGCFLLGCGAPLGPSIGLFDAMRIGPDVAPDWRARLMDGLLGIRAAPSAENSLRNVVSRCTLQGRLWQNDPDCVLLRNSRTRLGEPEVRSIVSAAALSGGLLGISDDVPELDEQRTQWLRRLLPVVGRTPDPGPLRGEIPDGLRVRLPDGSLWLLLLNLGDRRYRPRCDTRALGFEGPARVYDVWEDRALGLHQGPVALDPIPPHGCHLLRISSGENTPSVVGSTLHLAGGGLETRRVSPGPDGSVRVRLELPGRREGSILVALDREQLVRVRVSFTGRLDLSVAHSLPALEERHGIHDA